MRRAVLLAGVVLLALTGCAPTVSLTPAADADSARCAGVIVRLPPTIDTADKRQVDAQGTAAWGSPVAVTLRCGVPQPAPSSQCTTIEGVDWVLRDGTSGTTKVRIATTFDRSPAVQVVVDPVTEDSVSVYDALPAISDAITPAIPRTANRCTVPTPAAS